ncbi:MAG: glycosyltransferase, partial [Caldilineaceae bacterium]|nr:glycosyltransferase [Caldilineaceae bacterium]
MSDDLTPKPTSSGADDPETAKARQAQLRRARERAAQRIKGATTEPSHNGHAAGDEAAATASSPLDPVAHNETYRALRAEDRVVMRHEIALNLDSFRAAPEDFVAHTPQDYPPLRPAQTPFFSVIIPNYNGARFLTPVFTALQRQTLQDFEVILADDASTDDSVALVERSYPAARILVNRRNLGFVRTCNLAVAAAHGRYVVLLNNDTEPETSWLAELAKVI